MPILKVFLFHTVKYLIVPVCYLPFIQNNLYPLRNNQVNLMFLALPKFACIRWK